MPDNRGGMIGRVYTWQGSYWRVVTRWQGRAPRNVLIEQVLPEHSITDIYIDLDLRGGCGRWWRVTGVRVVRPFRGLRKLA